MENEMCMPNEPDELERVMRDSKVVDWFIAELTRSPRASGARSLAPSLPDAGSGADSQHTLNSPASGGRAGRVECPEREGSPPFNQHDFNRDAQATGV